VHRNIFDIALLGAAGATHKVAMFFHEVDKYVVFDEVI
jgi:hypothetical protein